MSAFDDPTDDAIAARDRTARRMAPSPESRPGGLPPSAGQSAVAAARARDEAITAFLDALREPLAALVRDTGLRGVARDVTEEAFGIDWGTLNALVTFAAENVPGGLSEQERAVAQAVGRRTVTPGSRAREAAQEAMRNAFASGLYEQAKVQGRDGVVRVLDEHIRSAREEIDRLESEGRSADQIGVQALIMDALQNLRYEVIGQPLDLPRDPSH